MCISWNFLPLASTSISTGVKKPGIADDASSTSRNSLTAASSPFCAIAPMSQITRRPESALVVTTSRRRPFLCSAATAATSSGVTRFSSRRRSGQVSRKLSWVCRSSKMSAPVICGDRLAQFVVELGAEEGVGREQRADAHAGDDAELGPLAGLRPAVEQAGGERAVGAAARHREPRAVGRTAASSGSLRRCRPRPARREIRARSRLRHPRRCRGSASADPSASIFGRLSRPAWPCALAFFLRLRVSGAGRVRRDNRQRRHDTTQAKIRPRARLATTRFTAGLRSDQTHRLRVKIRTIAACGCPRPT